MKTSILILGLSSACCLPACGDSGTEHDGSGGKPSISASGCDVVAPTQLAAGELLTADLSLTEEHVFWRESPTPDSSLIRRVAKTGGEVTTFAGERFATSSNLLFWQDQTGVNRQLVPDGPPESIIPDRWTYRLTASETMLAWAELDVQSGGQPHLFVADTTGANLRELTQAWNVIEIALDDQNMFIANSTGSIRAVPLDGGPAVELINVWSSLSDIVIAGSSVYYSLFPGTSGEGVFRVSKSGGAPTQVSTTAFYDITVHGDVVVGSTGDRIVRIMADGNEEQIASAPLAMALATDGACVYWSEAIGARLMKAPLVR